MSYVLQAGVKGREIQQAVERSEPGFLPPAHGVSIARQ
jgi:hypothetical protein